MAKIIERNVPIAEENETLSGQPAKNMFEDWSEDMTDRADNVFHDDNAPMSEAKKTLSTPNHKSFIDTVTIYFRHELRK